MHALTNLCLVQLVCVVSVHVSIHVVNILWHIPAYLHSAYYEITVVAIGNDCIGALCSVDKP